MEKFILLLLLFAGCASPPPDFTNYTTGALHLRLAQCQQKLGGNTAYLETQLLAGQTDLDTLHSRVSIRELTWEKEALERELLRRYEAGDSRAYLPLFGPYHP
jgi:hypothetical protein